MKNKEAKDMFDESLRPTRQHDRTIVDAVDRRAEVKLLLAASAAKLIADQAAVNDPANLTSHDQKKVALD